MTNTAKAISTFHEAPITEAQRRCLSHVLRNSAAALENIIALVENRESQFNASQLAACLSGVDRLLHSLQASLNVGSFCALADSQCQFVSKFVGCDPSIKSGNL